MINDIHCLIKDKHKLTETYKTISDLKKIIQEHQYLFDLQPDGTIIIFESGNKYIKLKGEKFIVKNMFDKGKAVSYKGHPCIPNILKECGLDFLEHGVHSQIKSKVYPGTIAQNCYYYEPDKNSMSNRFYKDKILPKILSMGNLSESISKEICILKIILKEIHDHFGERPGYGTIFKILGKGRKDQFFESIDNVFKEKNSAVCLEFTLIMAFFLETAKEQGFLKGKFSLEMTESYGFSAGHAWITYKFHNSSQKDDVFIVDPVNNIAEFYKNLPNDAYRFYWNYYNKHNKLHFTLDKDNAEQHSSNPLLLRQFKTSNKITNNIENC